ncbi:redoxin domain-containing protein [Halorubraceae archaeon YAN]|nr:redoxin domain-containing protein [Halorubraceae archaeon YAN]
MVAVGDRAPDFTLPLAGGDAYNDLTEFQLSAALGDGPIVLAFYPAAFTSGCTEEMCAFRDSMAQFNELNATVYGISVDLPFAQNIWIQSESLNFPMLSDWNHEVIKKYDVVQEDMYGMVEVAQRSIFILDSDGIITYKWVRDDDNPDFESFISDLRDEVETITK